MFPPPAFDVVTAVMAPELASMLVDVTLGDLSAADVNVAPAPKSGALLDALAITTCFNPLASTNASETLALIT